jgi:hypothetical protein
MRRLLRKKQKRPKKKPIFQPLYSKKKTENPGYEFLIMVSVAWCAFR